MKQAIHLGRPTQALVAANLLVCMVIALQLVFPALPSPQPASAKAESGAALPEFGNTKLNPPTVSELVNMVERPLFYVDRRMPEPPIEAVQAAPPRPLRLELEGVAIAGGSRVAVLRNIGGNGLLQLAEGESHDGWTLETVSSTTARFTRGDQVTELQLDPGARFRRR